jgi:hypothetical protein
MHNEGSTSMNERSQARRNDSGNTHERTSAAQAQTSMQGGTTMATTGMTTTGMRMTTATTTGMGTTTRGRWEQEWGWGRTNAA